MKDFIKYTLATICGILLVGAVMTALFFVSIIGMAAAGGSTPKVEDNSVFVLKLNGVVQERGEEENPFSMLLGQADMEVMGLNDIVSSIHKAKDEQKIKRMTDFCKTFVVDHVPDPYYGGAQGFENVIDILEDACNGLLLFVTLQHKTDIPK